MAIQTGDELFTLVTAQPRFIAWLLTAFAVLALARYGTEGIVQATIGACAAFAGGATSSAVAAGFGQRARGHAWKARADWKRALKLAEARLAGSDPTTPE